jgi:iron(III) transport system substrate-binding protein
VGLAERLRAEKSRPRADVWWGNEPFHTILLAEDGMFAPYESPSAADVPAMYRDPKHRWAGNGLRARVFITTVYDSSVSFDLDDMSKFGFVMARPTTGTTAGHVASLYVVWGDAKADQFFRDLRESGVKLLGGNGPVAEAVARGEYRAGLTDNDDFENVKPLNEKKRILDRARSVPAALSRDDPSVLMIPTTVALVAGRPESAEAKKLVDYLLSPEVEKKLIDAQFAGWSIRGGGGEGQPKAMQIDYVEVAKKMPEAVRRATAILEGREP